MKISQPLLGSKRAFTLLEMSIVILMLLAFMKAGMFTYRKMDEWKLARTASETLRLVYSAQRMYLADHPTADVGALTAELIIPYLPNRAPVMPTVQSLTGTPLSILVNVSPPHIDAGGGVRYDPSASPANYTDFLWDVGE